MYLLCRDWKTQVPARPQRLPGDPWNFSPKASDQKVWKVFCLMKRSSNRECDSQSWFMIVYNVTCMGCPAQFLVFTLVDLLQMLFQVAPFLCGPPSYIQVHNPTGKYQPWTSTRFRRVTKQHMALDCRCQYSIMIVVVDDYSPELLVLYGTQNSWWLMVIVEITDQLLNM